MITETHFTPNINFKIHDYITHRKDYPDNTVHAGAAILVSSKVHHYLLLLFHEHAIQAANI